MKISSLSMIGFSLLMLVNPTSAQWSANAAQNNAVADKPGDQAVPKVSAISTGGAYVAWFDHAAANYDVYLQRLDGSGYEQFPHNGILVSSQAQNSSLVDWDLITDSGGNAVLVFTDVRAGGDLDVYAYRIAGDGSFLWGANGITLSNDANFEANPVVAELSDGTFAFAWSRSVTAALARLVIQKLDASGSPLLGPAGIEIFGGPNDDPGFVGIVAAQSGEFILSWIRDTTPFTAPRHLHTQKYDGNGVPQWGVAPVAVYDAAALPIAFKPELQSDGSGGAFHAWHVSVGSFFQGRVQHIDTNGLELFPHNGVEISLEANRSEFNPSIAQLQGTGDLIVFYNKRNSGQSMWGIGGQRISGTGQLLWGPSGIEFVPYDATTEEAPRAVPWSNGAFCFVEQGNFNTTLLGFGVDSAGSPIWTPSTISVCSTVSPKDKLRAVATGYDSSIVVWDDARVDTNNVYAQNVESNGAIGLPPLSLPYGCGFNPAGSLIVLSGAPSIGTTFTLGIDDPTGSMPVGSTPLLAIAVSPAPGFPCGIALPNTGMLSPSAFGELLVDLNALVAPLIPGSPWAGAGTPSPFALPVPPLPALYAATAFSQGVLYDVSSGRVGFANALFVRIGL